MLEIGPGGGALTDGIAAQAGAVTAIEIDRDLAAALERRLPGVKVLCADVLKTDLQRLLADECITRVVGNLPYNISSPLLDRLFALAPALADMHFMLQAEMAARLVAAPGVKSYGRLSVLAQYFCRIETLFAVHAESFMPPPEVQSAFVRLTAREREPCHLPTLRQVLRHAFSGRRKTLRNALKSLAVNWPALAIDSARRAEELSVPEFVALANHLRPPSRQLRENLR